MPDISAIIRLIQSSPHLTEEEKERRIRDFEERVKKHARPSEIDQLLKQAERGIYGGEDLLEFCRSHPGIRRWYVARVYGESRAAREDKGRPSENDWLDLYYSEASQILLNELEEHGRSPKSPGDVEKFLAEHSRDNLSWWKDEDFDRPAHLPKNQFRELLNAHSSYPPDQPVIEGMIFIEISSGEEVLFIQFTPQAREMSKEIVKELSNPAPGGQS